jgi:PAS domain S-box-containing protein
MKTAFTLGLRGRLLLLLLAAFALLAGLVAWDFVDNRKERIGAASADVLVHARLIAAKAQGFAARADAILNGLMLSPALRPGASAEACSQALAAHLRQEAQFLTVGKALPDGDVACAAVPPKGRVSIADRNYFKSALQSREMVASEVITARIVDKRVISFAKAMRNDDGEVVGVLYLSLDLTWLERELASAHLHEGARLVVVDSKGTIAARQPDPEGRVGMTTIQLPLLQRIQAAGGDGTDEDVDPDGERRLFAYTKLLETVSGPIYLWLSVPKAVVEAPARRAAFFGIVILLTVLVSTIGLLVWGGNRLVLRPLLILSRAAARFKAGDLAVRTGLPHGDDEVGGLARTLDETAAAIEDRERKLGRANRALRVLSAGNRALLRSKGEQDLLDDMCRVIVQAGDYRMAWVAYAEDDPARSVRMVAAWGAERDSLDGLKITWGESESGRGPTGTAIRRGVPIVSNDIVTDPDYTPWRELAQRKGLASVLGLPLRLGDTVIGALSICAAEPDAFDEGVIELLGEAADDLAFGIAKHRAEIEHGRTRAALQTAEARFRAAAEAGLDALFILKCVRGKRGDILDFTFTDINARAEQMLGMARGQVIGQKLCELIPINRTGGFFDKYVAVVTTGTPLEEEFPIDTPQIRAKWLRHQVVRVGDGIAISSRDISGWKEAGAALKESEKRFRDIVWVSADWIWEVDTDSRYTYASESVKDLLGYTSAEVIGKTPFEFMQPEDAARTGAIFAAITARREPFRDLDNTHVHKDGSLRYVQTSGTPILGEDGRLLGYRGLDKDMTAKTLAERALARANRALRARAMTNEALMRVKNEEELLQSATRIVVEIGGYRMAGVGYAENDAEKSIKPIAWAGTEEGYIAEAIQTWADTELGQRPISRAIRNGKPEVVRDISLDAASANWRDAAAKRGYASNLALPLSDGTRVFGALNIYASEPNAFDTEETRLLVELADNLAFGIVALRTRAERDRIAHAHAHHAEILQRSLEQSIQVIAATVEARDPYTAGHQRRVGELAVAIGRELDLPEDKIHGIHLAAVIHDLGKIHVPAEILSKPGKLGNIEFMLIKAHPQAGYDILKVVDFPWPIADIVHQHHERLDGSGYPQGLKGAQILLESRILTVADVVEAMSSHRPYRAALGIEVALKEIERGRGSAYDPAVADTCLKLFREGKFAFQD